MAQNFFDETEKCIRAVGGEIPGSYPVKALIRPQSGTATHGWLTSSNEFLVSSSISQTMIRDNNTEASINQFLDRSHLWLSLFSNLQVASTPRRNMSLGEHSCGLIVKYCQF